MKRILLATLILLPLFSANLYAGDFEWSGIYRIEGYHLSNSEFNSNNSEKSFGLHHLSLMPKIEAADGITIRSRFELFNNSSNPNSQMGAIFGTGVGDTGTHTTVDNSNTLSQNQAMSDIKISQLYLTMVQEFGAFVAGRVPLHFGLGMTHNAGKALFDHWMDTRDLVGYKVVMGNLFFLPMYGKVNEKTLQSSDDITDIMLQVQHENPETGTEMGIFYQARSGNASALALDAPITTIGGAGAVAGNKLGITSVNVYGLKNSASSRMGLEASWQEGKTGVRTSTGRDVLLSAYGLAVEYEARPQDSKYVLGINAGYASGDDPNTDDKFEGFIFDRNYDVAFMMFNFALGQANFLRTETVTGGTWNTALQDADVDAISNTYYFSPYITYKWSDKWDLNAALTMGWLQTSPLAGIDVDKSLGYELDLAFNFSPNKNIKWVNQVGFLFPGTAFEGGSNKYDTKFGYGLVTKAAISF